MNLWHLPIEPRGVQLEAAFYSLEDPPMWGYAYFMEMRLGKTYTAINDFVHLRAHGVKNMVVIAPNRYTEGWNNEFRVLNLPDTGYAVLRADNVIIGNPPRVVITNYEALTSSKRLPVLQNLVRNHTLLVFDESVLVKNPSALRFKAAYKLAKSAGYVRILTGLPDPNGPQDYWAQLKLIEDNSGINGFNYFAWKATFCMMGGWKMRQVMDVKNPDKLKNILDRCAFIARRKDWVHTYDTDYEIVNLKMENVQRFHYDNMEEEFMTWVKEEAVTVQQAVAKRIKMQQISSGFIYNENKEALELVPFDKTPKFLDLWERLTTEMSGKVIIVAHYRHTVKQLCSALSAFDPALLSNMADDTEAEKEKFNNNPNCRVLVAQSTSSKYGHNLMGNKDDPCLDMVFYENTYNLDTRLQVEQRPQGVDMQGPLHVLDYASSPVELDIIKALQHKKGLSEAILGSTRNE